MTKLEQLRALLKAATPGPWAIGPEGVFKPGSQPIVDMKTGRARHIELPRRDVEDAALIVALRNSAEALLDVAEAARFMSKGNHSAACEIENAFRGEMPECDCGLIELCAAIAKLEAP